MFYLLIYTTPQLVKLALSKFVSSFSCDLAIIFSGALVKSDVSFRAKNKPSRLFFYGTDSGHIVSSRYFVNNVRLFGL